MPRSKPDIEKLTPKGRQGERRVAQIHLRLTVEERKKLDALAIQHGAELSEYIRAKALDVPPKLAAKASGDRAQLIQALGNLGKGLSNVNQIARAINGGSPQNWQTIETALQEIVASGQALRSILMHGHQG